MIDNKIYTPTETLDRNNPPREPEPIVADRKVQLKKGAFYIIKVLNSTTTPAHFKVEIRDLTETTVLLKNADTIHNFGGRMSIMSFWKEYDIVEILKD